MVACYIALIEVNQFETVVVEREGGEIVKGKPCCV